MTRSQKKTINSDNISQNEESKKRVENSWILLAKGSLLQNSDFNIVTLPHPAHSKPAKFCLDETHKKIYEIVTFNEPNRSWFTDQAVKSDARMLMLTPVNPIFLVLPYIKEQCMNRAIPLEDLMMNKSISRVFKFVSHLDSVADLKGPQEFKAYKYNETKTLTWLESKIYKVAKALKEKNIHVTSGAVSATFTSSKASNESVDQEFFLKYALGIIAEYVGADFVEKLENRFDFKPDLIESLGQKRKSSVGESNNKRIKHEQTDNKTILSESLTMQASNNANKQKPLTAKEKARQKAASGTKTISAFFLKK